MGFMPEKMSTRDKTLLGVAAFAIVAGGAGYYFMSKAPVTAEETAAAPTAQAAATDPKAKDKKPVELQETMAPQAGGGPRVNPDYKGDGK